MRYAEIRDSDNLCTNLIVWNGVDVYQPATGITLVQVPDGTICIIGQTTYVNDEFVNPPQASGE